MMTITDFYCNQKFNYLSVDVERRSIKSCCAATPTRIDLTWLKQHPGQLFNSELLQKERRNMLDNIPVDSCQDACWIPESRNIPSRRLLYNGQQRIHTSIQSYPETLNIILGSSCNLTCSYCDKEYSTAWLRDIVDNGEYLPTSKFQLTPVDQLTLKISQKEHQQSDGFNVLIEEIKNFSNLKEIYINGGEPFLYNSFADLVSSLSNTNNIIKINTGLGVNYKRLEAQLDKIDPTKVIMIVSAETTEQLYEFNRYGITYQQFCNNLNLLKERGFTVRYDAVISNLTIFGLSKFVQEHGDKNISYQFCNDPSYLGVNVVDPASAVQLIDEINNSTISIRNEIVQGITSPNTEEDRSRCSIFLKEFARRRNLSLDIFPSSLLTWLGI